MNQNSKPAMSPRSSRITLAAITLIRRAGRSDLWDWAIHYNGQYSHGEAPTRALAWLEATGAALPAMRSEDDVEVTP